MKHQTVKLNDAKNHTSTIQTCIAMLEAWKSICSLMGWDPNHLKAFSDGENHLQQLSVNITELKLCSPQGYARATADYTNLCAEIGIEVYDFEQVAIENGWRYNIDGSRNRTPVQAPLASESIEN